MPAERPERVLLGLIGAGIQASRSPELHEAAGAALGRRLFYHLIDAQFLRYTAADPPRRSARNSRRKPAPAMPSRRPSRPRTGSSMPRRSGMHGHLGMPLPAGWLRAGMWLADAVYTPVESPLIVAAGRAGLAVMTGDLLCIHQAAAAFRLFLGEEPNIDVMRATMARA